MKKAGSVSLYFVTLFVILAAPIYAAQSHRDSSATSPAKTPVVFQGDTLFNIYGQLGPFSPQQRAAEIRRTVDLIMSRGLDPSKIRVEGRKGYSVLTLDSTTIMAVTDEDAAPVGVTRDSLGLMYRQSLVQALSAARARYSLRHILIDIGLILAILIVSFLLLWTMRRFMPRLYEAMERGEGKVFRPLRIRSYELISAGSITGFFIVLVKGVRLAITLIIFYFVITLTLSLIPWTRTLNVRPALIGILLGILTTAIAVVVFKGVHSFFQSLTGKIEGWKGTLIQPVRLRTVEILSVQRIAALLEGAFKLLRWVTTAALAYFYISILFSFFQFTHNWARTLIRYIVGPLSDVFVAFVKYLPNLFFIIVIVYVTRYAIKFVKLIFGELEKGTFRLPGFYGDWAAPTYKIARFLIIAFAAIVIFPYLPGSSSPVFQGISVFLGVLFSLGSTSAIGNIVAGTVITYMRPFKIGDRVRIADTVGDVVEKTLLVTRIRTIKNVDITVPNAMVLGSHIINFSSSASERGLILHTSITIGYDVPWVRVHELLIAAAGATENVLKDPKPFVYQTALDDSYVSYELNAYTDRPNIMAKIYSDLHQNIQDKFNEAGVEIMSPSFSAIRDGNRSTIPESYLPKPYSPRGFRIFPFPEFRNKSGGGDPGDSGGQGETS